MTHTIIAGLENEHDAREVSKALHVEYGAAEFSVVKQGSRWAITQESEFESYVQHQTAQAFARGFAKGIEAL